MASAHRDQLVEQIRAMLAEKPRSLYEIFLHLEEEDYRTVLQAWGDVRARTTLVPDAAGRYRLPEAQPG